MVKKIICIIFPILFLSACDSRVQQSDDNDIKNVLSDHIEDETLENKSKENDNLNTSLADFMNNNNLNIIDIYGIDEDNYLFTSFKEGEYTLNLTDLRSGKIIKTIYSDTAPTFCEKEFWVLKSSSEEAMIFNYSKSTKDAFDAVYIYDFDFNQTNEIKLPQIGNVIGFDIDITDEKIYYTYNIIKDSNEYHCLNEMNFNGETKSILEIKYAFEHDYWLSSIYDIKKCINVMCFLGTVSPSANGSTPTVDGYGILKGNEDFPDYSYRSDSYNYEMEKFDDGVIIHDGGMPYGISPSGHVEYIKGNEQKQIKLQNPFETSHVYVSQKGNFFATKLEGKNEDGSTIYRITVYDNKGNVLKTEDHSFESTGIIHSIFLNEYSRNVYYNTIDNQGSTWCEFTF